MQFHTDEALGPTRSVTPEGFLICRDAVIGRTGPQLYHVSELPDLEGDADGWVEVDRPASEVFAAKAVRSFEGKPLTLHHPDDVVGPSNWSRFAVGHVANVRRGDPPDDDTLIADLVVTDQRGIDAIRRKGWKSLSCGYDAEYTAMGPGRARQGGIIGNHVAILPEGEARCGPRCAVGDSAPRQRTTVSQATTDMLRAKDAASRATMRAIGARHRQFWSAADAHH